MGRECRSPALCFPQDRGYSRIVCRGDAALVWPCLLLCSLSGESGQSSQLWCFGRLQWRPLRLGKLLFQTVVIKTKLFLGFSKLREGKKVSHISACMREWMNEWMNSGRPEVRLNLPDLGCSALSSCLLDTLYQQQVDFLWHLLLSWNLAEETWSGLDPSPPWNLG